MSYSIAATLQQILTVTETLSVPDATSGNSAIVHNSFNVQPAQLSSSSTPPISKMASFSQALTAGAATIDFTNLTGTNGAAVTGSGLHLYALLLTNPSAHAITIQTGASNGLAEFGASGLMILNPGASVLWYDPSGSQHAIDSTHKTLDLAGTGTDTLNVVAVMGT